MQGSRENILSDKISKPLGDQVNTSKRACHVKPSKRGRNLILIGSRCQSRGTSKDDHLKKQSSQILISHVRSNLKDLDVAIEQGETTKGKRLKTAKARRQELGYLVSPNPDGNEDFIFVLTIDL